MPANTAEPGKGFKHRLALKSSLARETMSEFLGTFIMIVSTFSALLSSDPPVPPSLPSWGCGVWSALVSFELVIRSISSWKRHIAGLHSGRSNGFCCFLDAGI